MKFLSQERFSRPSGVLVSFFWKYLDGKAAPSRSALPRAKGVSVMPFRAIAFLVILGLSVLMFVEMRKENRADAAGGNCYASAQGPSAPTICQ